MKRKSLIAIAVAVLLVVVMQPTFATGVGFKDVIVQNTSSQPVPVLGVVTNSSSQPVPVRGVVTNTADQPVPVVAQTVTTVQLAEGFLTGGLDGEPDQALNVDARNIAAIRIVARPHAICEAFHGLIVVSAPFRIAAIPISDEDVTRLIELPGQDVVIEMEGSCPADVIVYGRPN
jgi:hypothetical protein